MGDKYKIKDRFGINRGAFETKNNSNIDKVIVKDKYGKQVATATRQTRTSEYAIGIVIIIYLLFGIFIILGRVLNWAVKTLEIQPKISRILIIVTVIAILATIVLSALTTIYSTSYTNTYEANRQEQISNIIQTLRDNPIEINYVYSPAENVYFKVHEVWVSGNDIVINYSDTRDTTPGYLTHTWGTTENSCISWNNQRKNFNLSLDTIRNRTQIVFKDGANIIEPNTTYYFHYAEPFCKDRRAVLFDTSHLAP